jgi:Regulator of chromosome condensation (RCC1) repeat
VCQGPSVEAARRPSSSTDFSLVIVNGTVFSWGLNDQGQLGDGSNTNSNVPTRVQQGAGPGSGVLQATAVFAGNGFSRAIGTNGNVFAWGRNVDGELGDGDTTNTNVPVGVCGPMGFVGVCGPNGSGFLSATAISAGALHTLAIGKNDGGRVFAWGDDGVGQLGVGSAGDPARIPVLVCDVSTTSPCSNNPLTGVTAISAAGGNSMAIGSNSFVPSWGDNTFGQLGDGVSGSSTDARSPIKVLGLPGQGGNLQQVSFPTVVTSAKSSA